MTTDALPPRSRWLPSVSWSAVWRGLRDFAVHAVAQVRVIRKAYPGVMHALIFWGMTVQILGTIVSLLQIQLFVPFVELGDVFPVNNVYLVFELVMDLAGVAILLGVMLAIFRRGVLRPRALETRWDDWYALILLTLVPLLGFTTEGLRIVASDPAWARWSFAGNAVAGLFTGLGMTPEAANRLHYGFYWVHMISGLVFVASIPFTKLRHLITGPLNIVLRLRQKESVLTPIENIEEAEILGVGQVSEFAPRQLLSFDACVRCGRCEEACPPTAAGMPYTPRAFIQSLRRVMADTLTSSNGNGTHATLDEALGDDAAWYCTTCGACLYECPMFINPVAEIIDLRRSQALTTGKVPQSAGLALRNIERQSNPWGLPAADRAAWAEGLDVRVLQPGEETDVLLFAGCAFAYDDRNKQVGKALVKLLKAAGVEFAILGDAESCCGETARRLGNEYIFQVLAEQNIEALKEFRFNRIVTPCAHCYNTLKNEYPQFGGEFTVLHHTELLSEVASRLPTNGGQSVGPLTFHDSCYLGRYNRILDQPRTLLDRTGAERIEMRRSREKGFCCGGGGGQMWMETDAETRINNVRLGEALDSGADVVATACPYCLLMFDDAIRTRGVGEQIQVLDVAEVLARHVS